MVPAAGLTRGRPGRADPAHRRSCSLGRHGRHGRRAPPPQPEPPPPLRPARSSGGRPSATPRPRPAVGGREHTPDTPPAVSPLLHSGSGHRSQKWGGARQRARGTARGGDTKRATCTPHAPPPDPQDGGAEPPTPPPPRPRRPRDPEGDGRSRERRGGAKGRSQSDAALPWMLRASGQVVRGALRFWAPLSALLLSPNPTNACGNNKW